MVMEGVSFAECGSGPHGLKTMDFEGHQAMVGFGDRKEGEVTVVKTKGPNQQFTPWGHQQPQPENDKAPGSQEHRGRGGGRRARGLTRTRLLAPARQVFRVEVRFRGRRHTVPRRYSEFHALHKRIKKLYKVPEFPSKRLPNWRTRGLEQRRQGLEAYIQGVLYLNQDVPKELLEFLSLRHFPTDPRASSWGALGEFLPRDSSSQLHHRPVVSFCMDPYICISPPEPLPNVVVNGVLQGFYGFSTSTADTQSEAPYHPAPLPPMP
ncbi:PREDICTED: sorting nexin-22 [Miniopterus natalensis]|uniref:sorting nexin-22 n=1 Tax=Miniopterus natalensis TaxID=291302 RepID=UPI0007A6E271|nr:PREDICTED: sorting nexin-22 [Miniopterus natalensis]